MKIEDCPDLLHLDVVLKRVKVEPCLLAGISDELGGERTGVAISYELQLGKKLIEGEALNADETGLPEGLTAFVAEVRMSADMFAEAPADEVCKQIVRCVERDLEEAVLDFAVKLRREQDAQTPTVDG